MSYSEYRVGDNISIGAVVVDVESLRSGWRHGVKGDILTVAITGEGKELEVCAANTAIHFIARPKTGGQVLYETHFDDIGGTNAFGGWDNQDSVIQRGWETTARRLGITGYTEVLA